MRHAFLIIAHNNWWQLKKLIEALDYENHDLYVHIDKKSKDFDVTYFNNATKKSKLTFYTEFCVFWGGYSQVQVELFLLEKARAKHYDYYHIISGADLPLKNNMNMDKFFEINKGKEFILYDEKALIENPEILRRTKYYHFLQDYRRRYKQKWKNDFFTFCERVLLVLQIIFHVNREKGLEWKIKYGSNWVSITDDLVTVVLENKGKIKKIFSYTNCADELFIQTIAYNCGFRDKIYEPFNKNQAGNVRFIDWERGKNGNPYTFKEEDYNKLIIEGKKNDNLFARKFSELIDKKVILLMLNELDKESN